MAFLVEDGTGIAGANAYVSIAWADAYFSDRAVTAWTGTDPVKQAAIIKATDYIEARWSQRFGGQRKFPTVQSLSFPRTWLFDNEGREIQGVPDGLMRATAEYALRALTAELMPDPVIDPSGLVVSQTSEKIGPIEESKTFATGSGAGSPMTTRPYPIADAMIAPFLSGGGAEIQLLRN